MSDIVSTAAGPVLELVMNRPDKRNALTRAMYTALADGLDAAAADPAIRAVLIAGAGGAFTAGNDLGDFLAGEAAEGGETPVSRFLRTLIHFEKPIVAAVSGAAVGVGTTMLLHCDLVYADPTARLQLPFVNIGLVPEAGSSLLLPRVVGMAKASELLLLGEPIDAEEAARLGLVSAVVPDVLGHARARAAALAARPAEAVRATKKLLRAPADGTAWARAEAEGVVFAERLRSDEARAAMQAFFTRKQAA